MNWIPLNESAQIAAIQEKSKQRPQVIFKHSTRCAVSQLVKKRLERNIIPERIDFYFLDLIAHRPVSNKIAETFNIDHESPQVLLINNEKCIYQESHLSISMDELIEQSQVN